MKRKLTKVEIQHRENMLRKALTASVAFVRKAALRDPLKQQPPHVRNRLESVYIHPTTDDGWWKGAPGVERAYIVATDGMSLHAALLPGDHPAIPEDAVPYSTGKDGIKPPDMAALIDAGDRQQQAGKRQEFLIDAVLLRKAIHPQAATVSVSVADPTEPVEVFSFAKGGEQIGYAMFMPQTLNTPDFTNKKEFGTRPHFPPFYMAKVKEAILSEDGAAAEESREDSRIAEGQPA